MKEQNGMEEQEIEMSLLIIRPLWLKVFCRWMIRRIRERREKKQKDRNS